MGFVMHHHHSLVLAVPSFLLAQVDALLKEKDTHGKVTTHAPADGRAEVLA